MGTATRPEQVIDQRVLDTAAPPAAPREVRRRGPQWNLDGYAWGGLAALAAAMVMAVTAAGSAFPSLRLPFGQGVEATFNAVMGTSPWLFDGASDLIAGGFNHLESVLVLISPPVLVIGTVLTLLYTRGALLAGLAALTAAWVVATGLWVATIETVAFITVAVVASAVLGVALGVIASTDFRLDAVVRVVLDAMQAYPAFGYLVPIVVMFGTGNAGALVVTVIWALPPIARLTALGLRDTPPEITEAATSVGTTRAQLLWQVHLPMARASITAGLNQTVMFAVSMTTLSAMIGGAGLGAPVWSGLTRLEFGQAMEGGIALVLVAMILDRATSPRQRDRHWPRWMAPTLLGTLVAAIVLITLSPPAWQNFAEPPAWLEFHLRDSVSAVIGWLNLNVGVFLESASDVLQIVVLTPMTDLLLWTPWPAVVLIGVAIGLATHSIRVAVIAGVGIFTVGLLGMWEPSAPTIVVVATATLVAVLVGFPLGVLMCYSETASRLMRPVLDVLQTLPVFLWVIPVVMVLGSGAVPGTFATIAYAIPPIIRLTYTALRGAEASVVEATTSMGCTRWQQLWDVRVPLGMGTLLVGLNQCILLALSMAVVGAFIGTPGLGQEILTSVTFVDLARGINAGTAMLIIAVVSDRVVGGFAARVGGGQSTL